MGIRAPNVRVACVAACHIAVAGAAWGADAPQASDTGSTEVSGVTVVSATPLPGTALDVDKIPSNTQTLSSVDLSRDGTPSVTGALSSQLGSVNINDNLDDAMQPNVLLRGFEASPVLGTPQGVAVYQNGVRINEAFGDTVNWDLIPDIAIRRMDVLGSNPVFGLNALGGAISLEMKNGFTEPGGDISLSGGSFGQWDAIGEYGANNGTLGFYVAARGFGSDGWREFSPDHLRQFYADFSARTGKLTVDLSVTAADNDLYGEGATPIQELAVDRALIFTSPQQNTDKLAFVTLNATYAISPTLSLQGAAYYRGLWQNVVNGNATDYTACETEARAGNLCQGDKETPLTDLEGRPIPDISNGGTMPIGENDFEKIGANGGGGSLQITSTARINGAENYFSFGGSVDSAVTNFNSSAEPGVINAALQVQPSGYIVGTPEDTPFNPTPVKLRASSTYYGVYVTDTFNPIPRLSVTASGRFNVARINLLDLIGTNLTGDNRYERFNPALGVAYKIADAVTVYVGYSQGSRAPNASEIECSNPLIPCLLPSSLASDPPTLQQVVAYTWEGGFRGHFPVAGGALTWNAGLFHTDVSNDIYGVATSVSAGYFQNIPGTRREGVELGLRYNGPGVSAYASYSYIDATFQSTFLLPSAANPFQDENGNIQVVPGDQLPGVPRNRLKLGADVEVHRGWSVGGSLAVVGSSYYLGDESNQLAPLPAYVALNLHTTVNVTRQISLFATIDNVTDAKYATFGLLGDPTGVGAPGIPPDAQTNDPGVDNRFQSPAAPISAYGGVKVRF